MKKPQNIVTPDEKLEQSRRIASIVLKNTSLVLSSVEHVMMTKQDQDRVLILKSIQNALETAKLALRKLEEIARTDESTKPALDAARASFENARDALSLLRSHELPSDSSNTDASPQREAKEDRETVNKMLRDMGFPEPDPRSLFEKHYRLVNYVIQNVMRGAPAGIDADKLREVGSEALIKAAFDWRENQDGEFESYALTKISDIILKKVKGSNNAATTKDDTDNTKKLKSSDFENALKQKLKSAQDAGKESLTIVAKELHNEVVEQINTDYKYPGPNHRIPACCSVMRKYKRDGDSDNGKRISPLLEVTYYPTSQNFVESGSPSDFDQVWKLIEEHEGEPFYTKTGKEFTYKVDGDGIIPSRTVWRIPKSNFRLYYDRGPVNGPAGFRCDDLKKVQGPSYLWAVMHDDRIRPKKW